VNVLAIIPARGGSKGVKDKNLRCVGGKTLVSWAIEAAKDSNLVTETIVSTDSHEIMAETERCGAKVHVRPPDLATDTASTDAVMMNVLAMGELTRGDFPDLVVLLQPTVPVRARGLVDDCIQRLLDTEADSLLTAYRLHFVWRLMDWTQPPRWTSPYSDLKHRPRRQDMERHLTYYAEDGSVFVSTAKLLRETGARLGGKVEVFETQRTVDIDTEEDLVVAEALIRVREAVPA
jgi:N-acylneuraminate cytidylyltransferase